MYVIKILFIFPIHVFFLLFDQCQSVNSQLKEHVKVYLRCKNNFSDSSDKIYIHMSVRIPFMFFGGDFLYI